MESLTIGELARSAGVHIETVRYYERRGLLEEPQRSPAGYRQYDADALWRLQFIGRAKQLGFTLAEIIDIVGTGDERSVAGVLESAHRKLRDLERRQQELEQQRSRLGQLVNLCETGDPADCLALATPDPFD